MKCLWLSSLHLFAQLTEMKRLIKYLLHVESSAVCSVAFGFRSVIGCRNGSRARTQKSRMLIGRVQATERERFLCPELQLHHKTENMRDV